MFNVVSVPLSKAFDNAKMRQENVSGKRINMRFQKQVFLPVSRKGRYI
jgi:hypothetical protein